MPASSAMSTQSWVHGPQSSASAPVSFAAKLASAGTTSRWSAAFISGASLKNAAGASLSIASA
jgi:hypothetical protein